jgi:hypothetical protein
MMTEWNYFFATSAGASGGLIGLLFVAISVNHNKVVASGTLPARALISVLVLFNILTKALLFLVPNQKKFSLAIEITTSTLLILIAIEIMETIILKRIDKKLRRKQMISFTLAQIALLPFVICSVGILLNSQDAIYWLVPGIIFSFLKALADTWVLLIEVNR